MHALVGEAVADGMHAQPLGVLRDFLWRQAAARADTASFGRGVRSVRVAIAGHAAVYLRRFAPPAEWSLVGTEVALGQGDVVDVVWMNRSGMFLIDEIKLAGGLEVPAGDGPTRDQARRYALAGRHRWGAAFAGVRVVLLGAPRRSFLIGADLEERPLLGSPYWFDHRVDGTASR